MSTPEARSKFLEAGRERIAIIGSDRDTYRLTEKEFADIGRLLGAMERDDINADARAFRGHAQEFYEKTADPGRYNEGSHDGDDDDFDDYLTDYFNPGSHGGDDDDFDEYEDGDSDDEDGDQDDYTAEELARPALPRPIDLSGDFPSINDPNLDDIASAAREYQGSQGGATIAHPIQLAGPNRPIRPPIYGQRRGRGGHDFRR